eukprot:TRINITY_DN39077_c0_g1_i1.p1 TRINITY_DN39077_c0_g1~~TRINITY_DN39077_c0_g1_i1.p1  ORF type:complete len:333 (+),score=68.78 TRINITY_DN39077_c0_g1_i1:89-1000(+)
MVDEPADSQQCSSAAAQCVLTSVCLQVMHVEQGAAPLRSCHKQDIRLRIPHRQLVKLDTGSGGVAWQPPGEAVRTLRLRHVEKLCRRFLMHSLIGLAPESCSCRLEDVSSVAMFAPSRQRMSPFTAGVPQGVDWLQIYAIATRNPDVLVATGSHNAQSREVRLRSIPELRAFLCRVVSAAAVEIAKGKIATQEGWYYGGLAESLLSERIAALGCTHPELLTSFLFTLEAAVAADREITLSRSDVIAASGLPNGGAASGWNQRVVHALYGLHRGDMERVGRDCSTPSYTLPADRTAESILSALA